MPTTLNLATKLRHIPNFPKEGVMFYDITPLLEDPAAFKLAVDGLADAFGNEKIDKVVGIDARGFLVAAPVAYALGAGLAVVRKKGKLPYEIIREYHELEYGHSVLEMHVDAIKPGEKVVLIDDVLATGGTAEAAARLIKKLDGNLVGMGFLIELVAFPGRQKLAPHVIHSLVTL